MSATKVYQIVIRCSVDLAARRKGKTVSLRYAQGRSPDEAVKRWKASPFVQDRFLRDPELVITSCELAPYDVPHRCD